MIRGERKMAKKKRKKALTGVLSKHKRGFGFVTCDELEQDVFIAAESMNVERVTGGYR